MLINSCMHYEDFRVLKLYKIKRPDVVFTKYSPMLNNVKCRTQYAIDRSKIKEEGVQEYIIL